MPIYEYECPKHKVFELYFHRPNDEEEINCPKCEDECEKEYMELSGYVIDPFVATRIFSTCTMKPDKYWSGQVVGGHYVTSEKEANKFLGNLEPATMENREYIAKRKSQRMKEWEEKRQEGLTEFLNQELSGVDDSTFKPDKNDTVETYKQFNDNVNKH